MRNHNLQRLILQVNTAVGSSAAAGVSAGGILVELTPYKETKQQRSERSLAGNTAGPRPQGFLLEGLTRRDTTCTVMSLKLSFFKKKNKDSCKIQKDIYLQENFDSLENS